MSPFIIAIILSAALLHAVWNAIVKTAVDRTTTLGLVAFGHVIPGGLCCRDRRTADIEAFCSFQDAVDAAQVQRRSS